MLNPEWKPSDIEGVELKWSHIKVPSHMTASEAESLMMTYLQIREDWLDQYVNATYYLDKTEFRHDTAYQVAYMRAGAVEEKPTEKQKEAISKSDPKVIAARMELMRAKAAVVEAKAKLEGSTLAHHAVKKLLEKMAEEKYL